jgi:hypothetical protein
MIIYTANQGNSLTFGILFPESYLMANARNINVQIGGKRFEHTVIDKMVRVELQSADTIGIQGAKELVLSLDDVANGVRKVNLGQIKFDDNTSTFSNQSINQGYNFTVVLSLSETAIEVTDVMYEYVKGERGGNTAFEIEGNDLVLYQEQDGESIYEIEGNDLILNI